MKHIKLTLWLVSLLSALLGSPFVSAQPHQFSTVYTSTNSSAGNAILIFSHRAQEGLVEVGSVATGGTGTDAGLGNQSGLVLSQDRHFLFAVNAGSNSVSVFKVQQNHLKLLDVVDSQGLQPVSLTQSHNKLFVLNAGSDSIAGFTFGSDGKLTPIADSVAALSGTGTGPAQISFSPWGDQLVVTEKATNSIVTFELDQYGKPRVGTVTASAGATPFGFAFDRFGHLIVSEAAGGAQEASSVSSYALKSGGGLKLLSGAVPTTETAACWVLLSANGRTAFTTNTGSSSVSSFKVKRNGTLELIQADGVAAETGEGSAPIDMALSSTGHQLYVLSARNGTILSYRVVGNKFLQQQPGVSGLPTSVNGLAAF